MYTVTRIEEKKKRYIRQRGRKKITGKINRDTGRNRDRDSAKTEVHSKENKVEKDCEKRENKIQ